MKRPPEKERRLCGATFKLTEVLETYYILLPLQVRGSRAGKNGQGKRRSRDLFHHDIRRCVACSVPIDNSNLGGHRRKSALAGDLWCYDCAN